MLVTESRAKDQIDCTLVVRECLDHLFRLIEPNGRFIYAHRADRIDDRLDGYNVLRHCGTVWFMCTALSSLDISLSSQHRVSLANAVKYVLKKVQEPSWGEAGLPSDEGGLPRLCLVTKNAVKLGGTGLALLMLRSFRALEEKQEPRIVNLSKDHDITVARLENYVLSQASSGDFIHKRNFPDGKIMTFRSDYYTGEAIYGLFQGSRITPQVQSIVEGLLNARYGIDVQSHWMAYAACEALTKGLLESRFVVPYLTDLVEAIISDPSYRDRQESTPIACRSEALTIFLRALNHAPLLAMQFSPTLIRRAQEAAAENLSLQMTWYNKGQFRKGNGNQKVQIDYIQHNAASFLNFSLLQKGLSPKGLLLRDLAPRLPQPAKTTSRTRKHEPALPFKTRADFPGLKENEFAGSSAPSNSGLIVNEFESRGFERLRLGNVNRFVKEGRRIFVFGTSTGFTSYLGYRIFRNRTIGKQLINLAGAKTAEGREFRTNDFDNALAYARSISPCVVKPVEGNLDSGVTFNVTSSNFLSAWKAAERETSSRILVERFVRGQKARYVVVDNQCVAVLQETQPFVVGDGLNTIATLIDKKNKLRNHNPYLNSYPIVLEQRQMEYLAQSALRDDSVVENGQFIALQDSPDLTDGGDTIDITLQANPRLKSLAESITSYLPGLDIVGFDVIANDHCAAGGGEDYIFLEGHIRPNIKRHLFPVYGQPIDLARIIVDYCECRAEHDYVARKQTAAPVKTVTHSRGAINTTPIENSYAGNETFEPHHELSERLGVLGFKNSMLGPFLLVEKHEKRMLFRWADTSFTSYICWFLLSRKHLGKILMSEAGISVADGVVLPKDNYEEALEQVKRLSPAVLKPANGNKGNGVSVNVTAENFDVAWQELLKHAEREIIVERFFSDATEMRYLVVDGKCVAVAHRLPPHVIGDGSNNIESLVRLKNNKRKLNPDTRKSPIELTPFRCGLLADQGLSLKSVPAAGERVIIDPKGGISSGGDAMDTTSVVHPGYRRIAEQVWEAFPQPYTIGVDLFARDHTKEPQPGDYIVIEANTFPGFQTHLFPSYGEPIDVYTPLVESSLRLLESYYSNPL
jgi:D-alanine-D-alanine ligase-like ATP-grasp enzyme